MDYIRKLPLLMALTGAIVVGFVGYTNGVPNRENMLKMVIIMVIFYIAGTLVRNTITAIMDDIRKKAEEKERLKIEEEKKKEELERKSKTGKNGDHSIDLVADDELDLDTNEEDFDALPVADFIKKELNH